MGKEHRRWRRENWNILKINFKGHSDKVMRGRKETEQQRWGSHCSENAAGVRTIQKEPTLTVPGNIYGKKNLAKTPSPVQICKGGTQSFPKRHLPTPLFILITAG